MSLDQLLATNIFSRVPGGVQSEYKPFCEALAVQAFADAINEGKMRVEDAWTHFWSYEEDAAFWELPNDREWRCLLPDWEPFVYDIGMRLTDSKLGAMRDVLAQDYLRCVDYYHHHQSRDDYNPFQANILCLSLLSISRSPTFQRILADKHTDPFTIALCVEWNKKTQPLSYDRGYRYVILLTDPAPPDSSRDPLQDVLSDEPVNCSDVQQIGPSFNMPTRALWRPAFDLMKNQSLRDSLRDTLSGVRSITMVRHAPYGKRGTITNYTDVIGIYLCALYAHTIRKPKGFNPPRKKKVFTDDA